MAKINYSSLITESESELESRLKKLSLRGLRDRCEVLLWLKSGKLTSMRACLDLKGYNKSTGVYWWKIYQSEGIDKFLTYDSFRPGSLLDNHTALWDRLGNEGFSTIKEARDWLASEYRIEYTENGLGNYFRSRKVKCKTGRPFHPKQSEEERIKYKKNMKQS